MRRENAEQADTITRLTHAKSSLQSEVDEKEEQLDQFRRDFTRKDAYVTRNVLIVKMNPIFCYFEKKQNL